MEYRTLGATGWKVSAIGFGAWGIGGQWGEVDDKQAISALHRAYDVGINFFDTADAYGIPQGRSEELVGRALRGVRDEVFIATKVGNWARRFGAPLSYTRVEHVIGCCDASLFRLKTDYIDLYQCHIANLEDPSVFLEAFETLKKAGKIRAYGISTDSVEVLKRFNQLGTCATCQLDYSMLNRHAEAELLPYCQEHQIGTIIRGPLAKGLLSGKFTAESRFDDEVRSSWNDERRDWFLERVQTVEKLRFLEKEGRTMAQAALQYVLAHQAVSVAIPGAKSPAQVEANAKAADGALTAEELERVRAMLG